MLERVNSTPVMEPIIPGVKVKLCKHGTFCYFVHDSYIGRSLDLYGEYSEGEVALFAQLLKPGHVVFEVGANIGTHTVPLARLVENRGRVFAFEAQRVVHQQLCANVALNGLLNVWTYNQAVGASPGEIGVPPINYMDRGNFGGVELVAHSDEMVPMVRLDDHPADPHFIKIDVEGMEHDVLLGAKAKIEKMRPVLYIENDRREKSAALIGALLGFEYDAWWHLPLLFNPNNWHGVDNNIFPNIASSNMLCVPAEHHLAVTNLRKVAGPDDLPWGGQ